MSAYLPESGVADYEAMQNDLAEADALYMAGKDEPVDDNYCRCELKRVHVRLPYLPCCIHGMMKMVEQDIERLKREIAGWVPWYQTGEFKEARQIVEMP